MRRVMDFEFLVSSICVAMQTLKDHISLAIHKLQLETKKNGK